VFPLFQTYGQTFTPIEVKNKDLNDIAVVYKDLTDGIILNETMSDYILRQVSYCVFV
jgi:hypothetical protein